MGIASVLALILVVLKALGLITIAWGWCLAGFGFDIVLAVAVVVAGYFFGSKITKKVGKQLDTDFDNWDDWPNL